ncbi:HAD-IA family hydrolase [Romeria aff. gracilis LEGE 07310]|uniref:HAD-IA family hydrolase n=1 Tax=Vasconcelosia minhoensis LEGE 07310 TaxID=915328 RepID=A0A8J7AL00_9CYAN|nr:HAD-IA family hydrolase [Romeria gracilis]MBE9076051.1 HAD-IA family hydrolase [Romeria aff. gracilis LEGE 07310]
MAFLIFDFDGTIADTLDAIVRITNRLAAEYGYPQTTPERLKYYQTLNTQELLKQSEIPFYQLPFLLRRVRRELGAEVTSILPIAGLPEALRALAAEHQLVIASSNSPRNIQFFLEQHQLSSVFNSVYANVGLLGKARVLNRLLRRLRLEAQTTLYVGDETRDIEAARQVGIAIAAVSWGFSSRQALAKHNPTFLVDAPGQLVETAQHLADLAIPDPGRMRQE